MTSRGPQGKIRMRKKTAEMEGTVKAETGMTAMKAEEETEGIVKAGTGTTVTKAEEETEGIAKAGTGTTAMKAEEEAEGTMGETAGNQVNEEGTDKGADISEDGEPFFFHMPPEPSAAYGSPLLRDCLYGDKIQALGREDDSHSCV